MVIIAIIRKKYKRYIGKHKLIKGEIYMLDIATRVAKMRLNYHANAVSLNNALNQLHIISDDTAEQRNRNHVMIILTDITPRLGKDVEKVFKNGES